ncbi:MAG: T9SS type A sorting domain-containing protein [Melioribacteraceae bacterium]|nr:T9SS type A sorting domain-containing protein [Melioribacteraceae bacterium]
MFKKSLILFFVAAICSSVSLGQGSSLWQSYSSKKEIVAISSTDGNQIWCATTGGSFMYENSSSSFLELGTSDGLTSPILTSLVIDNSNKIWFGTQVGAEPGMINVYEFESGIVKKVNDIFNSDFTQKAINDLEISGDTIIVSTAFGLSLVNPNNYSFYDTFIKFGSFEAATPVISANKFGRFFVLTAGGIAVQKRNSTNLSAPESWDTFSFSGDLIPNNGFEFAKFGQDILLATDKGIFRYVSNNWELFQLAGVVVENIATNGSNLFITTLESGVSKIYEYNGTDFNLVFENMEGYSINDLFVSSTGIIYAATKSGLLKIESTITELIIPQGPANNAFLSLDADNDGTLWVGTGRDVFGIGVMSFDGSSWDLLSTGSNPNVISNAYHNVYVDNDNTKYFCNWGRGLTKLEGSTITNYTASNSGIPGIPADPNFLVITDVKKDSKGNVWLLNLQSADRAPLSVIRTDGSIHNFQFPNPQITESELAFHLEIDQFDTKWFAITVGDIGLYYFNENGTYTNTNDDKMGWIRTNNGLLSNSITSLALDRLGSLWVGTNLGVSIIPDPSNPTTRITTVSALRQQSINAIEVDPLNQKWVGTVQGLFHLSSDGTVVINSYTSENSPLPSNDIKSVTVDGKNGIVYIGTDFGLTTLKTSSVTPSEGMEELFVYPNPVIIKNNKNQNVTIEGLMRNSSIKILSISGKLIKKFSSPGGNVAFWDSKDEDGNFVPSGVYLIIASDEDGSNVAKGKVAILRE